MKSILLFFVSLFFFSFQNEVQAKTSTFPVVKHTSDSTTLYIYTWGIIDTDTNTDLSDCEKETQQKYGFTYKSKGACMIDDLDKLRRLNSHNADVRAILEERHGANWEEKYERDLNECKIQ